MDIAIFLQSSFADVRLAISTQDALGTLELEPQDFKAT